jgi:hypothetical protein
MTIASDDFRDKVSAIFCELVGDLAKRLDGSKIAEPAMSAIEAACTEEYGAARARDIGFHMADWNADAAFIVAVHLFPERFTREEIAEGVLAFLLHAPSHIRAACKITGLEDWVEFALPDERGEENIRNA